MSHKNDLQAYILANQYGFCPAHAVYPAKIRNTNTGKYEPDHNETADSRTIVLAHFADATNMLIRYNPAELIPPD